MGKTKTAFVAGTEDTKVTGAEKYKERQKKKAVPFESLPSKDKKEKVHIAGLKGGQRIKIVRKSPDSSFDGTVELHLIVKRVGLTSNVMLHRPFWKTKKIEIASDET